MLQTLKTMAFRYNRYMTHLGRMKARDVLLQTDDRLLEDAGISRELLEKGVSAWPWQVSDNQEPLKPIAYSKIQNKQAVEELSAYSDSELHDLGITRGTILEAVKHGRHGIERQTERKAA